MQSSGGVIRGRAAAGNKGSRTAAVEIKQNNGGSSGKGREQQ
jgi:hypothetical protein